MYKTQIGNIQVMVDSRRLTFRDRGKSKIKVSFPKEDIDKLYTFLGNINIDQKDDEEPRAAYRIPIPNSLGLSSKVSFKDKSISVTALNLSLAGVLVEYSPTGDPQIAIGAKVSIVLSLGSKTAELSGVVSRCMVHSYGISFPESTIDQPSKSLFQIFKAIETYVFRLRVK